jgi:uncharacterized SAM-binding protein YcdF (DUF218 family)
VTYTQPLLTIFFLIAAAALGVRDRLGRRLATISVLGLFCVCWPPVDWLFSRPLEARYAVRPFVPMAGPEALVVLSEGVELANFERPYPLANGNTTQRCLYAAWIYRRYGARPVLVSGGRYALTMRDILVHNDVAASSVWIEEQSQSTRENAVYSADILRQHGIARVALVVDATSMPRAAACFRKLGIEVVPAPSRFREFGPVSEEFLPTWKAIQRNEDTLHETLGLLWYWTQGWI